MGAGQRVGAETLGEQVHHPVTVGPQGAAAVAEAVGAMAVRRRRGDLHLLPGAASVLGGKHEHRYWDVAILMMPVAAEIVGADVGAAEEPGSIQHCRPRSVPCPARRSAPAGW